VRWASGRQCGLRTQDRVPLERLGYHSAAPPHRTGDADPAERRVEVRLVTPQEIADRARTKARLYQTVLFLVVAVAGAILFATLMYDALEKPLGTVADHLP